MHLRMLLAIQTLLIHHARKDWECLRNNTTCFMRCMHGRKIWYTRLELYHLQDIKCFYFRNAVIVIGAGFFLDKLGNKVGCFLFSGLVLSGSAVFALGAHFKGEPALFPIMLIGRLLFGAGNGSLTSKLLLF